MPTIQSDYKTEVRNDIPGYYLFLTVSGTDDKYKPINISICRQTKDKNSWRFEIYWGKNYLVGSVDRSRSRGYSKEEIPRLWKLIFNNLVEKHNKVNWDLLIHNFKN